MRNREMNEIISNLLTIIVMVFITITMVASIFILPIYLCMYFLGSFTYLIPVLLTGVLTVLLSINVTLGLK